MHIVVLWKLCVIPRACRNGRIPVLPPIINPSSDGGIRRLPAPVNDSRDAERVLSRLAGRLDVLEQASFDVQQELAQLRADVRTRWREDDTSRCVLRREVDALKESLRMKEEALEALTKLIAGREAKLKHIEDALATTVIGNWHESLTSGCKEAITLDSEGSLEGVKKQCSLEEKLEQSRRPKDLSPSLEHEMHVNEKAAVRVIWQELERLCKEHITLVTASLGCLARVLFMPCAQHNTRCST